MTLHELLLLALILSKPEIRVHRSKKEKVLRKSQNAHSLLLVETAKKRNFSNKEAPGEARESETYPDIWLTKKQP
jgi:hypothetical protein